MNGAESGGGPAMDNISPDASLIVGSPRARPTPNLSDSSFVNKSDVQPAESPRRSRNAVQFRDALEEMLPPDLTLGRAVNAKVHFVKRGRDVVFVLKVATDAEKVVMELVQSHPYCVPCRVYPFFVESQTQPHWVMQMPYYPHTLQSHCMQGTNYTLDEEDVWSSLLDMALALHQLAAKGVVHKDFKDANILCAPRFLPNGQRDPAEPVRCVLADFGVASAPMARPVASLLGGDGDGVILAPEAIQSPSHKSDMFSLGLTMASLRSSCFLPLGGSDAYKLLRQGSFPESFLKDDAVSPALRKVLDWLISVNPADRPSAHDLLRTPALKKRLLRRVFRHITACSFPIMVAQALLLFLLLALALLQVVVGGVPDAVTTACVWWLIWQAPHIPPEVAGYTLRPKDTSASESEDEANASLETSGIPPFSPYESEGADDVDDDDGVDGGGRSPEAAPPRPPPPPVHRFNLDDYDGTSSTNGSPVRVAGMGGGRGFQVNSCRVNNNNNNGGVSNGHSPRANGQSPVAGGGALRSRQSRERTGFVFPRPVVDPESASSVGVRRRRSSSLTRRRSQTTALGSVDSGADGMEWSTRHHWVTPSSVVQRQLLQPEQPRREQAQAQQQREEEEVMVEGELQPQQPSRSISRQQHMEADGPSRRGHGQHQQQ